jgi:putative ABC transport system permease protein
MLLKIAWKNLTEKKLTSFLCVLLMTLGIALISLLVILGKQIQEKFKKNIEGIDMVVGAKGSPLQLILSSIYQVDNPTGNISLEEVDRLAKNPMVKETIPLSMGDNHAGFRIIGTTPAYLRHFKATLKEGSLFSSPREVVVGSWVAEELRLAVGDTFQSSHGLDAEGEKHEEKPYKVVGIVAFTNSVVDNMILTSLASIWDVHDHNEHEAHSTEEAKQVTSILVKFRSKMALMTLPRQINENTTLQAALPFYEIDRLSQLMGVGIDSLRMIAFGIMLISGISVFVSLYNSLKERKYEMALMLSMGATRLQLFMLLLLEGLFLGFLGFIIGIFVSRLGVLWISHELSNSFHYEVSQLAFQKEEGWLLGVAVLISILAAALPSVGIYRLNISKTLAQE